MEVSDVAGGGYTGDGRFKWFVEMNNARDGETKTSPRPGFDRGLKHEGTENATPPGADFGIFDRRSYEHRRQARMHRLSS